MKTPFKFYMNDRLFEVKKVSQDRLHNENKKINDETGKYFGMFLPYTQEILLSEELTKEQIVKTFIHELTHCYIWCYMTPFESLNEEDVCNINSNSFNMINEIVSEFKNRKDWY